MRGSSYPSVANYKFHDRQPTRLDRTILTHLAGRRGCDGTCDWVRLGMPRLANLLGMPYPPNQCRPNRRFKTWIEFLNRLTSLPLGFSTLLLAFLSFKAKRYKWWVIGLSWFCLADVIGNAIMGAIVVSSGLQPGIITLHMALAFLLIAVLITIIWMTRSDRAPLQIDSAYRKKILVASLIFFSCLFCEGLMGSQLREQTDQLAQASAGMDRSEWIDQLGATLIYKVHRSFSWTLLITSALVVFWISKSGSGKIAEPKWIFAMVIAMMLMGIVLAHVAIFQVVQVLHVGCTAVLLAITWHWILRLFGSESLANPSET